MKLSLGEEALADAQQAADWYIEQDAWQAAMDLHDEIAAALSRLIAAPGLGTPGPHGTRLLPLRRFPFSLIYRWQAEDLRVIALAAHRRKPRFWSGRS